MFERTLRNDLGALPDVARDVRLHLEQAGIAEELVYTLDLALEELVTNIVCYAYDGARRGEREIRIAIAITPGEVRLVLADDGRPFDPTAAVESPAPASLEEAHIGGLGIQLVRRMVKDIRYRRTEKGNELELALPLSPPP